jgi:hypothetical protein
MRRLRKIENAGKKWMNYWRKIGRDKEQMKRIKEWINWDKHRKTERKWWHQNEESEDRGTEEW